MVPCSAIRDPQPPLPIGPPLLSSCVLLTHISRFPLLPALLTSKYRTRSHYTDSFLWACFADMGWGEPGLYPSTSPHGRISTPNLDQFGREGIQFTHAYAGYTVCAPSRTTLVIPRLVHLPSCPPSILWHSFVVGGSCSCPTADLSVRLSRGDG